MRTSIEILDALKLKLGVKTDYAIHKKLRVTRQYVSKIRNGRDCWSDDLCVLIAELLEVSPILVLATVHAERSKSEVAKKHWFSFIDKFKDTAAAIALGLMLNTMPPLQPTASATEQVRHNHAPNIHYTKRRRKNRAILSSMVEQLMNRPRLA
jgi:hypothetical protein